MKKILLFLLVAACVLYGSALAEEPEWECGAGKGEISQYNGPGGDVVIPDTVDGCAVTALCDLALYGAEVTSLVFPDTLRSIGDSNLFGFEKLTALTLPEGLEVIGGENFFSLPALTELQFPASVAVIERSVSWCDSLRTVTFLGMCPVFVEPDFCFCVLPDELTVYVPDDQLEAYRAALVNLQPDQVLPSGRNAVHVDYTATPDELVFDASTGTVISYIGTAYRVDIPVAVDGVPVRAIGDSAFEDSRAVCAILPEGVEKIGDRAFVGAWDLSIIQLPGSLQEIGEDAFTYTWLEEVVLPWDTAPDSLQAWQDLIDSQVTGCSVRVSDPPEGAAEPALPMITPTPQPAVTVDDSLLPYTGIWYAILLDSGIAPMDAHGLDIELTLYADGTGYFSFDDSHEAFCERDGQAFYGEMPLTLREDGRLMYGSPVHGAIYFSRDPLDVMAEEKMATVVPMTLQTPAPVLTAQAKGGGPRMDVKYLAATYTASGITMDASILGAEYSLIFQADGQCSVTTGGMSMPTMTWIDNGDGTLTLDYMGALTYTAVMNGDSLEVDLGGMVLTYAPEE